MAYTIMNQVGKENEKAVIATTILAFAISSIITGLVFFSLGALKLGSLIGFFPRHILVGCIGGVGWFLIVTALEVCAHLDGSLTYTLDTLKHLFDPLHLAMWGIPCLLAIILMAIQHFIKHPMVVPMYFLAVPIIFYIVVLSVPSWHLENMRDIGWIFEAPEAGVPFWHFYTLYGRLYLARLFILFANVWVDFGAVDWKALLNTVPAMFALTFFGILHVPINVPALAISTQLDDLNLDRELRAHGISNAISGMFGSIQV
jgi:sulfate permease, SulP family